MVREGASGVSKEMEAVCIRSPGGPEVLELRAVSRPDPGKGEVRVRVAASGVNRADLLQRKGLYPAPSGYPQEIPGLEFSGKVEAVGPGSRLWKVGDPVMGIIAGGGYARFVVVEERTLVRVPRDHSPAEAAAIPEAFMTAFDALFLQAELGVGETVLIHAVGSGVGTAGLQLALEAGATVLGTSRTPEKLDRAREMGLHHGFVGRGDWAAEVAEVTGGSGADVILDLVGGPYLTGNQHAIAERGRHVVVGVPGGRRIEVDLRRLMQKRAVVRGTVLRARPSEEKVRLARVFERRIVPLFERGSLHPVLDRTYAPADAPDAHRLLEENRSFGKALLLWGDDDR